MKVRDFNITAIHALGLAAVTNLVNHTIDWTPDYWLIVVRLTAGYITVYQNQDRGGIPIVLNTGTIRLPFPNMAVSVERTGATGFYSLYAIRNLDGFDIKG
jgi:hypothetical protein